MFVHVKLFLASFFLLLLLSCNQGQKQFSYKAPADFYASIVEEEVNARPGDSYMLYLPSGYDENELYPLLICFSPNGDGHLPVKNLRFAGESFGYIVVGSNDVKNRSKVNGEAIRGLIYDVQNKFSIDASRMYACGFSGGARLATVLGNQGVVEGVISCGAGPGNFSESNPYPWYGIVGKSDFNYDEFTQFTPQVIQKPFYTAVFHPGGHEWPDSSYLYDALAFMQVHACKSEKMEADPVLLSEYKTYMLGQVDSLLLINRYREAFQRANDAATLLSGQIETSELIKVAEDIHHSNGYKADVKQQEELEKLFDEIMKIYPVALVHKDSTWWKNELQRLEHRTEEATGEAVYTFKRVKSTLGILCYSVSSKLLQNNSPSLANVLAVYQLLEPQNADMFYFKSKYELKQGNEQAANTYLERAKELGFSDY